MNGRPWRTPAGLGLGMMALTACGAPVPAHETPGWEDSIAAVQAELATVEPDPTPIDPPEPAEDPVAGLTTSSPNAVATSWNDLEPGQCILWPFDDSGGLGDIAMAVPCDEPHYGEMFQDGASRLAAFDEVGVDAEVDAACEAAFEDYVGLGYWQSIYYYSYMYPTESGWDTGDRSWQCFVFESDNENTGSLRDVAR